MRFFSAPDLLPEQQQVLAKHLIANARYLVHNWLKYPDVYGWWASSSESPVPDVFPDPESRRFILSSKKNNTTDAYQRVKMTCAKALEMLSKWPVDTARGDELDGLTVQMVMGTSCGEQFMIGRWLYFPFNFMPDALLPPLTYVFTTIPDLSKDLQEKLHRHVQKYADCRCWSSGANLLELPHSGMGSHWLRLQDDRYCNPGGAYAFHRVHMTSKRLQPKNCGGADWLYFPSIFAPDFLQQPSNSSPQKRSSNGLSDGEPNSSPRVLENALELPFKINSFER